MLKCPCSAFFLKIMCNTLVIFVTHFFHSLNVKESKKNISCTSSMENHLKIEAQNKKKKTMIWTLAIILKCTCSVSIPFFFPLNFCIDDKLIMYFVYQGAGLVNLGNTCFLNAILQCFTHTVPLVQGLRSSTHPIPCSGELCLFEFNFGVVCKYLVLVYW